MFSQFSATEHLTVRAPFNWFTFKVPPKLTESTVPLSCHLSYYEEIEMRNQ
jgi:hypothetical protein